MHRHFDATAWNVYKATPSAPFFDAEGFFIFSAFAKYDPAEVDLPEITADEVLIRVVSDSVCASTYKAIKQGSDRTVRGRL